MGRLKELYMEQVNGGYNLPENGKVVCAKCFLDYAIQEKIESSGFATRCSYCGRRRTCIDIDACIRFISKGVLRAYEDPANEVGYSSADGGYNIIPTDGYDLMYSLFEGAHDDVREELQRAFAFSHWVNIHPYSLPESEALSYSWEAFCKQVKHGNRYLFQSTTPRDFDGHEMGHQNPSDILKNVVTIISKLRLINILPRGSKIYRARQHADGRLVDLSAIASPPSELASQNRMSASGISRFYGASTSKVARLEATDLTRDDLPFVTVGHFHTSRELHLLNLTNLPQVPSIFDEEKYHLRDKIGFLHDFVRDVSKSIARDNRVHYEYVPTQIIAEYFQKMVCTVGDGRLDGIAFPSSRNDGGICYTLFYDYEQCMSSTFPLELASLLRF